MKTLFRIVAASLLLAAWTQTPGVNAAQNVSAETFIGSTPGGEMVREVLGGLEPKVPCHAIAWEMKLFSGERKDGAKTYELSASYQIPTPENPNRSMEGPKNRRPQSTRQIHKNDAFLPNSGSDNQRVASTKSNLFWPVCSRFEAN